MLLLRVLDTESDSSSFSLLGLFCATGSNAHVLVKHKSVDWLCPVCWGSNMKSDTGECVAFTRSGIMKDPLGICLWRESRQHSRISPDFTRANC